MDRMVDRMMSPYQWCKPIEGEPKETLEVVALTRVAAAHRDVVAESWIFQSKNLKGAHSNHALVSNT